MAELEGVKLRELPYSLRTLKPIESTEAETKKPMPPVTLKVGR